MRTLIAVLAGLICAPVLAVPADQSVTTLTKQLAARKTSSVTLVKAYLARIAATDDAGPHLNAVLATYPDALEVAARRDAERSTRRLRGALHGIPILIKDNIDVAGPIATTAGSLALAGNVPGRDAPLVARLRAAGAIMLGKTNLSEWANIRSSRSTSGWSAVGGLTRNPHVLNRSACGSSSGSGAAIAAGLAAAAIGTETDGSIICPSASNGIVGFKPTVGLVSRTHVVPISHSQDTPGPMTLTVRDAAILLTVMAASDPADPATADADTRRVDYAAGLKRNGLKGLRIGVMVDRLGKDAGSLALFAAARAKLTAAGATLVDIADTRKGLEGMGDAEFEVLLYELKADLAAYLATTPPAVTTRTLADVIAFNTAQAGTEMKWFGQDIFEQAQAKGPLDTPAYLAARTKSRTLARAQGIDRLLADNKLDLLIGISNSPAWTSDFITGDHGDGPDAGGLAAIAGYPHLTVPMGVVHALPVGISFIGRQWDDARVLAAGYAYEQASQARVAPGFVPSLEARN